MKQTRLLELHEWLLGAGAQLVERAESESRQFTPAESQIAENIVDTMELICAAMKATRRQPVPLDQHFGPIRI